MEINATIIGQLITFLLLVWFMMKWVWPPIIKMLEERKAQIAAGLAAAEQGQLKLINAEQEALEIIQKGKVEAAQIIEGAVKQSQSMIAEAREEANRERMRIVNLAKVEIDGELVSTREVLKKRLASLAVAGAEQIIRRNIDGDIQKDLLEQLAGEIE